MVSCTAEASRDYSTIAKTVKLRSEMNRLRRLSVLSLPASLYATASLCLIYVGPAHGQTATPAFEVVSIKPTPKERLHHVVLECTNGRFVAAGWPLSSIVEWGYRFSGVRLLGLPEWTFDWDLAYDFRAEGPGSMSQDECRLAVQSMLIGRFEMRSHREHRRLRAYALVIDKKGHKLHVVSPGGGGGTVVINGARFQTVSDHAPPRGISMGRLANILSDNIAVGLPVVDRTGLQGIYGFDLEFAMTDGDDRPSVFAAVRDQLGLRLTPIREILEVLVVDHIERPSGN